MRRIFPSVLVVLIFALGLMEWSSAPAFAGDPPPGLPWGKGTPWPTAMPLSVGKPFSPNSSAPPVIRQVQPLAVATKVRPVVPVIVAPVVPTPVPPPVPVVAPVPPTAVPPPAPPVSASSDLVSDISNALNPGDTVRTLSPGGTVWFRIGSASGAGVNIDVWLDVSADNNVDLAIYAPNQLNNLSGTPAGHGTPFQRNPKRLHWKGGGSNAVYGVWYARITNNNPMAIDYKLTTENVAIAPKSCVSYWEYIGTNYVYWTACQ